MEFDFEPFDSFTYDQGNKGIESPPSSLPPTPPDYCAGKNPEIRSSNSGFIQNTSNGNYPSSFTATAYKELHKDKIEKSQGPDVNGQPCNEPLASGPGANTASTVHVSLMVVEHGNQVQTAASSNNKRRKTSHIASNHQTEQRLTTQEYPMNNDNGIAVILATPLAGKVDMRTDRGTALLDIFGKTPTLILTGSVPHNIEMEMTMISTDEENNSYYSLYLFEDYDNSDTGEFERTLHRNVEPRKCGDNMYMIKLNNLRIRKQTNWTSTIGQPKRKIECKLVHYPSENEKVEKKGTTNFAKDYNLYRIRLAIRFISNGSPLPVITKDISRTQSFFVSNEVTADPKFKRESNIKFVEIDIKSAIHGANCISFEGCNQYNMLFSVKFPKEFEEEISSGDLQFEIALAKDVGYSSIYYIKYDTAYGQLMYTPINETCFEMPLTIVKQTFAELQQNPDFLRAINFGQQTINGVTHTTSVADINSIISANGLNSFRVEFRLVHGEKRILYPSDPIWQRKFTEFFEDSSSTSIEQAQETFDAMVQNPINIGSNVEVDYSRGLPVYIPTPKTTENDYYEQSTIN